YPFHGDQAYFMLGARVLRRGDLLYRDFWDNKGPAIYLFYLAGSTLFGFSEAGVHLFELLVLVAFSTWMVRELRGQFARELSGPAAPIFTVGAYYTIAKDWHLTQVEPLAAYPLFVCVWLSYRCRANSQNRPLYAFLSGAAAGVVALFKWQLL